MPFTTDGDDGAEWGWDKTRCELLRELAGHLVEACTLMGKLLDPGPRLRLMSQLEEAISPAAGDRSDDLPGGPLVLPGDAEVPPPPGSPFLRARSQTSRPSPAVGCRRYL